MLKLDKNIGSSFYKLKKEDKEFEVLSNHKVHFTHHVTHYYSGRNAIYALLEEITSTKSIRTIWLPNYYCHNVKNSITKNFEIIKFYEINPFEPDSGFNFENFTSVNDIIILNNYWGLYDYNYSDNPKTRAIVIEDHSHGWLSKQCIHSKADYCIASIRKAYPIPLGAITWRPKLKKIAFYENGQDVAMEKAYEYLKASLSSKRNFIKTNVTDSAKKHLAYLAKGENCITESNSYVLPKSKVIDDINKYMFFDPNEIKQINLDFLYNKLQETKTFKVIRRNGFTSFGLLLLFNNLEDFTDFKTYLIKQNIFPANLWPSNNLDLEWKYFYNIHVDFRYTIDDMAFLAETINNWIYKKQN